MSTTNNTYNSHYTTDDTALGTTKSNRVNGPTDRKLKILVFVLAFILEAFMITTFVMASVKGYSVYWRDWLNIIGDSLILYVYGYSLMASKSIATRPFRAITLTAMASLIFFTNFELIFTQVEVASLENFGAFECSGDVLCGLFWTHIYLNIVVGFLAIVESYYTLKFDFASLTDADPNRLLDEQIFANI